MDNTPQSGNSQYPRWLYPISVLWGTLMGILFYASARFPLWYTYSLGPSSEERGLFWDAGVFIIMALTGLISAIYFWLVMKYASRRAGIGWTYPVAAIVTPLLIATLITILWYVDNVYWADTLSVVITWLIVAVPTLVCLVPFGLLSGVIFYGLAKLRE
ncbi:MAG TPA: hypothetical protein EYP10_10080 [Armatimonadetes bacterium]|nr:hypothetical protein [Armatimonadota bacterium]